MARVRKRTSRFSTHPVLVAAESFLFLSLLGSLLLCLPGSARGEPVEWVDAFFTSTSAVCVTGLTVVDTGTVFSTLGQVFILLMIQLGGLGIMTFSVVFITLSGSRISLYGRTLIEQTYMPQAEAQIYTIAKTIAGATLLIEGVGAAFLFLFRPGDGIFAAVFHGVSAFCNAGFSLYRDSFMGLRAHWGYNLVVCGLIVLGGIGFYVIFEVRNRLSGRCKRLSLHARIALLTTTVLIVGGAAAFYFLEMRNLLEGLPVGEQVLASLFQSVTSRTAGFNTLDFGLASMSTLALVIFLMFVGASPGSTGGGIKTTTLGVLWSAAASALRGKAETEAFQRTIPQRVVTQAMVLTLISAMIICFAVIAVVAVDAHGSPFGRHPVRFDQYLFEVVSAFGTVGLSTGITAGLSDASKLMISLVMLVGRVGPLTLAFILGRDKAGPKYRFAEGKVMVG
ncbi:MAG: hypothetical protein KA419_14130 [Acidobacteria bacterium]|nr:hypothetical protein [Acidobacteriota bacterium]